jgi:hypothetical protein
MKDENFAESERLVFSITEMKDGVELLSLTTDVDHPVKFS